MVSIVILISAILAIIFGILILIWPKILNVMVAIWLILNGILTLIGNFVNLSI